MIIDVPPPPAPHDPYAFRPDDRFIDDGEGAQDHR